MTSKNDYKGILELFSEDETEVTILRGSEADETIQKALRIADRLQSGDVSAAMKRKGQDAYCGHNHISHVFKPMGQQLLKDVDDEY